MVGGRVGRAHPFGKETQRSVLLSLAGPGDAHGGAAGVDGKQMYLCR